jgi:hypothetical protein
MAVSMTRPNAGQQLMDYYKKLFGFKSLSIQHSVDTHEISVTAVRGRHQVFKRQPDGVTIFGNTKAMDIMQELDKQLGEFEVDLRYNSIESLNDFMALVSRELERNTAIDSVVLTPDQLDTLWEQAEKTDPPLAARPLRTIMGYEIIVRDQE